MSNSTTIKRVRMIKKDLDLTTQDVELIPETTDEIDPLQLQKDLIELGKSIDWKLWQMLQVMERLEAKLGEFEIVDE